MNDRIDFDVTSLSASVQLMREQNDKNKENKQKLIEYIDTTLSKEWNTVHGIEAVSELRSFAEINFQEYIDYLDSKINTFEDVVIPALNRINNA